MTSEGYGLRCWDYEQHECPERETARLADIERQREEYSDRLDAPDEERIRTIKSACNLPTRSISGLVSLKVTDTNRGAIEQARVMLRAFQRRDRQRGIYIHGPLGTGKTAILGALAFDLNHRTGLLYNESREFEPKSDRGRECIMNNGFVASVQFWPVPDWFALLHRQMDREDGARDVVNRIEKCEALLFDDIGKQYDTGHKVSELFRVINYRYNEMRSTSFTSNHSPEALAKKMVGTVGPEYASDIAAMVDRIRETCDVVELRGTSWRRA